jgi:xylose isomerase
MLEILCAGGFTTGGFNFDAKVRRQSIDAVDLFHGHVGAIDVVARALLRAAAIVEDGRLDAFRRERYAGWNGELGRVIEGEGASLAQVARTSRSRATCRRSPTRAGRNGWRIWSTGSDDRERGAGDRGDRLPPRHRSDAGRIGGQRLAR